MAKTVCIASTSAKKDDEDIYNASTDEEMVANEDNKSDDEFPELPDFFGGKSFFLYGSFSPEDRRLLVRYITAYNGYLYYLSIHETSDKLRHRGSKRVICCFLAFLFNHILHWICFKMLLQNQNVLFLTVVILI